MKMHAARCHVVGPAISIGKKRRKGFTPPKRELVRVRQSTTGNLSDASNVPGTGGPANSATPPQTAAASAQGSISLVEGAQPGVPRSLGMPPIAKVLAGKPDQALAKRQCQCNKCLAPQ
jgi:hypothetical protein